MHKAAGCANRTPLRRFLSIHGVWAFQRQGAFQFSYGRYVALAGLGILSVISPQICRAYGAEMGPESPWDSRADSRPLLRIFRRRSRSDRRTGFEKPMYRGSCEGQLGRRGTSRKKNC